MLAAAKSPKFINRARKLGFSEENIAALPGRVRSLKVGELPRGGWTDSEQILIGRGGIATRTREGRIFHELGHLLDDVRSPGLFARSAQRGFGFGGFYEAEKVAYGMQYGPRSIRGAVLAPYAALYGVSPTATTVGTWGFAGAMTLWAGHVVYEELRE